MKVTPDTLNSVMEFDHVIVVHEDGTVTDAPSGIYEPNLWDGELDDSRWTLMGGYSGQYGYSGPVMHSSEFIGGRMARDILATPGTYVAIVANYSGEDGEEDTAEGWAVARLVEEEEEDSMAWVVSDSKGIAVGERIPVLARFNSHDEAADFIGTLPECETGRYNLDGPSED